MSAPIPLVSVCIPTYNRVRYLAQCVESILRQTMADFEVVVSDNASNDGTTAYMRSLSDRRIRYERSETNAGSRENWNRCVTLARGTYVAILHDDDTSEPTFLARTVQMFEGHSRMGMIYTAAYLIDEEGRRTGCLRLHARDRVWAPPALGLRFLKRNHDVVFSSAVVRRSAYECVGRFDPALLCGDFEIWLKLALRFEIGYLASPLVSYRSHGSSTTASMAPRRFVEENRLIVNRVIDWAEPQIPGMAARRAAALAAVDRVWAWRSLQTTWKLLAENAMTPAAIHLDEVKQLHGGWITRCLLPITRLCLNPMGRRAAKYFQRLHRWCRGQWMMLSGVSTS